MIEQIAWTAIRRPFLQGWSYPATVMTKLEMLGSSSGVNPEAALLLRLSVGDA